MSAFPWQPMMPARMMRVHVTGTPAYSISGDARCLGYQNRVVVVAGVFDGLHRGHAQLVTHAVERAKRDSVPCVAVTFDPDPGEVLGYNSLSERLLFTPDRISGLTGWGVDAVITFSFTRDFAKLSPQAFLQDALCDVLSPTCVFVGENFRFGDAGAGDIQTLRDYGRQNGFDVMVEPLLCEREKPISATLIRNLLKDALLDEANELLGRCHYVRGRVEHGRGEGTGFGFPTANVRCDRHACMPAEGVYACYVSNGNTAWPAAVNVGAPPTFAAHEDAFLEANLLGFSGDLYGAEVAVSFVSWLRASRTFESVDELRNVVLGNIDWVREHLGDHEVAMRS